MQRFFYNTCVTIIKISITEDKTYIFYLKIALMRSSLVDQWKKTSKSHTVSKLLNFTFYT